MGFRYYSWTVSSDDGSRFSYDFEVHEGEPWTSVLRRFGSFLEKEGYIGAEKEIYNFCEEQENFLVEKLEGLAALNAYHSDDSKPI